MIPVTIVPQPSDIDGKVESQRAVVCSNGKLFYTSLSILAYGMYSFPLNCLKTDMTKYIPASEYLFYSIQSFKKFIWYSGETNRFIRQRVIYILILIHWNRKVRMHSLGIKKVQGVH